MTTFAMTNNIVKMIITNLLITILETTVIYTKTFTDN